MSRRDIIGLTEPHASRHLHRLDVIYDIHDMYAIEHQHDLLLHIVASIGMQLYALHWTKRYATSFKEKSATAQIKNETATSTDSAP